MFTRLNTRFARAIAMLAGLSLFLTAATPAFALDSNIAESSSHEILYCSGVAAPYTGCVAADLRAKADALGNPVAIYQYVRNNVDYALYHGARSGAPNTFLGGRGNDVDVAATLIAMLRSQGFPAQYVVGTVRLPAAQVMNWLGVENVDLAYAILRDQGLQGVVEATDKSTIDFEHVWVEALVPYGNYRGAGAATVNCVTTPAQCDWVPLDPSFKQHAQRSAGLDPYNALAFDYTSFYNAILANDATRRDKNPLEVYQDQIRAWLQTTAPGKTLADIPDFQGIVQSNEGLLPASLPFVLESSLRRYNSAADHDAVVPTTEPKKWMKYVTAQAQFSGTITLGSATVSLVDAATQRFTFTFGATSTGSAETFRLGGTAVGTAIVAGSITVNGVTVTTNTPFSLVVSMDGAPAPDSTTTDQTITATYNAIVGGYYLIATGGESSNWSQVHRAAAQLLAANQQYPIVFNPADPGANGQACDPTTGLNCTPYVDTAGTGVWASTDPRLLDSPAALDALTGGLLYVAGSQYYANFRDKISTLDGLNRVKTPISGFLGVVSTTYDVEYINGTAFQVLPGGLLIDMKGISFNGTWRIDQPATYSSNHFKLVGHIGSSLEHETWQQLTGYDAISTVRGIQMALFNNAATLVNPVKNATTDTTATMYPSFHYATTAPAGFTKNSWTLFGTAYESWSNPTTTASFIALRPNVQGYVTNDPNLAIWTVPGANTADSLFSTYSGLQSQVQALINNGVPLQTNVNASSSSPYYASYDVIGASTTAAGFAIASYARTSTTSYNYVINQTSALATGTYTVPINATLAYPTNQQTTTITLPAGYSISGATVTSGANFVVAGVTASTVTLGENAAHAAGSYSVGVLLSLNGGAFTATSTLAVSVGAGGRWVAGSLPLSVPIAITNTAKLSCEGATDANGKLVLVTYIDTPANLMTDLHGCFNNWVNFDALAPYISFFNPAQALYFRAVPTVATDQLTSKVVSMRDDLYLRDQTVGWVEYLIPSTLSVGSNFRFGVDLRMYHDTPTGNVTAATYEIVNDNGLAAGGGLVGPPFRRIAAPSLTPAQGVAP